jgi:hypothetical protein
MRFTVTPLKVVKFPPRIILPSDWTAIAVAKSSPPVPVLAAKAVSSEPFALRRAMRFTVTPLNTVKVPARIIFPSD